MITRTKVVLSVLAVLVAAWMLQGCPASGLHGIDPFSATEAQAEPTIAKNNAGLGAYAAMHKDWPCDIMMRGFKGAEKLRLAVLWNTFGNNWQCLEQFASDPRPKLIEFHLINEVCQRNRRCGKYEVLAGMSVEGYKQRLTNKNAAVIAKIKANVAPVASWLAAKPEVECSISAGLESNLDSKSYQFLVDQLRPEFPARCKWVWSPNGGNAYGAAPIPGLVYEGHGDAPPGVSAPCIVNLDGVDVNLKARPSVLPLHVDAAVLPRFIASFASCEASYLWIAEFNGNGRGSFVDPRKRTVWPTAKIADELSQYLRLPVEDNSPPAWSSGDDAAKAGCKKFLKIPDGAKRNFLWKQSEPKVLGRGAVTFLPTAYNKTPIQVNQVYVMKGKKKIATAYERKHYTEDGSGRQFYRFRKLAPDFPFNVVVHFGSVCAVVPNPKVRVD